MNYYPFGAEFCDGSANTSTQKRKYNGKEFDNMHGLNTYDYGARQYNPVTARWDRMDPLAENYSGVSPYVYCLGNPVKFIDPDGKEVHPAGSAELVMIQMTLPVEARDYVVLNKRGYIDGSILNNCPVNSYNVSCLQQLVDDKMVLDVILSDRFTWAPGNTKMAKDDPANKNPSPMSYFGPDPEFMDPHHYINDLSTGESANTGKTLFPDKDGLQNSPDENVKVVINQNLSSQGRAEAYSHEANGHGLLYIQSGYNHQAASHSYQGMKDSNRVLTDMIMKSKIETIENNR